MILRIELWYSFLSLSVRVDSAFNSTACFRIQIKHCVFYYSKPYYYWQNINYSSNITVVHSLLILTLENNLLWLFVLRSTV